MVARKEYYRLRACTSSSSASSGARCSPVICSGTKQTSIPFPTLTATSSFSFSIHPSGAVLHLVTSIFKCYKTVTTVIFDLGLFLIDGRISYWIHRILNLRRCIRVLRRLSTFLGPLCTFTVCDFYIYVLGRRVVQSYRRPRCRLCPTTAASFSLAVAHHDQW